MKLSDLKHNRKQQVLVSRVMVAMDKGYDDPTDIAVALGEPIELVIEAYQLIVDYRNKKSGK